MLKLTSPCTTPAASTGDFFKQRANICLKGGGKDAIIRLGCTYLSYLICSYLISTVAEAEVIEGEMIPQ